MPPATPTAAASAEMGVEFFASMADYESSSEDDDKGEGNESNPKCSKYSKHNQHFLYC